MHKQLLLVEDNAIFRGIIRRACKDHFTVIEVETKNKALSYLKENKVDVIVLDLSLPDSKGLTFLSELVEEYQTPVIVITVDEDPEMAAEVIKLGGKDYLSKRKFSQTPHILIDKISSVMETQLCKQLIQAQEHQIQYLNRKVFFPDIEIYNMAYIQAEVAISGGLTLLIQGETGVGKNRLVSYIHQKIMPGKPLVTVDCGAICGSLSESELFGHQKGAFTGADQDKKGKIEIADGGILFLDEISNAPIDIQKKLLRVVQERKVCRIGSNIEIPVSFILISATNKNLSIEIEQKRFLEDLYYRVKQVDIWLPPLRKNENALSAYISYFLEYYNKKHHVDLVLNNDVKADLLSQEWPGNLRELDLDIQRRVVFYSLGHHCEPHLSEKSDSMQSTKKTGREKHIENEKVHLSKTLDLHRYNVSATARELGVPRTTLVSRMKKLNL